MKNGIQKSNVKKINGDHYIATRPDHDTPPYMHVYRRNSITDDEDYNCTDHTLSEYTVTNEHTLNSKRSGHSKGIYNDGSLYSKSRSKRENTIPLSRRGDAGSDIYISNATFKTPSEISHHNSLMHSPKPCSIYSIESSKTGRPKSRMIGASSEILTAPNPLCPNVRSVCCLMVLLNLGLILVTLGFVIVIQFSEPVLVWILGIVFLIFGFATLIGSMIYCVSICRDAKNPSRYNNEKFYWTHNWQKSIGYTPHEINYKTDRYDGNSDRYSVSKISGKYSDRESQKSNINRY